MIEREKTHKQWTKHGLCIIVLIALILVTLFRGSKRTESIIGLSKCSVGDWLTLLGFIVISFIVTYIAIKVNKYE